MTFGFYDAANVVDFELPGGRSFKGARALIMWRGAGKAGEQISYGLQFVGMAIPDRDSIMEYVYEVISGK